MKTNIAIEYRITAIQTPERVDNLTASCFTKQTLSVGGKVAGAIFACPSYVANASCPVSRAFIKIAGKMRICQLPLAFLGMSESVNMIFGFARLEKFANVFFPQNAAMIAAGADTEIQN